MITTTPCAQGIKKKPLFISSPVHSVPVLEVSWHQLELQFKLSSNDVGGQAAMSKPILHRILYVGSLTDLKTKKWFHL
jgi:hypothetical protein